jgi:2-aminoadipate transaminase
MAEKTINLTRGMPPVEVFPTEDLIRCSNAALRNDGAVLLQYGRSPGYKPLRELLAAQYGTALEQVLIGNSSLEILYFASQLLLKPGARAFVEAPSYDRAITLLRRAGAEVIGIPLQDDGIDVDALEEECRRGAPTLLYAITDFQNPMGITMSLAKRQRLVELARRYDFWVLEDAPYRALRFYGDDVPTVWSLAPERVLHMSSYSKILAPGLRLGYVLGPAEFIARLAAWAVDTYIGPVFPTQGMVYEYCRAGLLAPNIEMLNRLYCQRLEATLAALQDHLPGAHWSLPEGGFYVGVWLPEGADVASLLPRADAAGVKITDGRGFFPVPDDGRRFLRVPFCSVTPEDMAEAIGRLAELL